MKKFIDNLISRLEEEKEAYSDTTYYALGVGSAIKIVNQLAEEYKPRTNADRIRNMSDEELAEYISSGEICAICPECEFYGKEGLCYLDDESGETENNCSEGILKWLQSEVKEGK